MSRLTLFDLPDEIIGLILLYLPYRSVKELQHIPEFRPYALRLLYKDVEVYSSCFDDQYDSISILFDVGYEFKIYHRPYSVTYNIFVSLIKDNTISYIQNIHFDGPELFLKVYESYSNILLQKNIIISFIDFEEKKNVQITNQFLEVLNASPYHIVGIETSGCILNNSFQGDTDQLGKYIFDFKNNDSSQIKELFKLLNIKILQLSSIPSNKTIDNMIHSLCCSIKRDQTTNPCTLIWPKQLKDLYIKNTSQPSTIIDLSHLHQLEKFGCGNSMDFKLPRNLKSLVINGKMHLPQLIKECPSLVSLQCCYRGLNDTDTDTDTDDDDDDDDDLEYGDNDFNDDDIQSNYDDIDSIYSQWPQDLKRLEIYGHFFYNMWRLDDKENNREIRFPQSLIKLELFDSSRFFRFNNHTLFSNLPERILDNLIELELSSKLRLSSKEIGPFPKFLRKLSLVNFVINSNDLKRLNYLTDLSVECSRSKCFDYMLPDSLSKLELKCPALRKVDIRAKNLQYFLMDDVSFRQLKVFRIPDTIKELNVESMFIIEIGLSFKLPPRLIQLSLWNIKLSELPELPSTLKRLSYKGNRLDSVKQIYNFPTGLEELNLCDCQFPEDFEFSNLNLLKCPKLKKLNLSYVFRTRYNNDRAGLVIDLSDFPKSLVTFGLKGWNAIEIIGNFTYFPNLKELDLRSNIGASDVFHMKEGHVKYSYLPDTIQRVWISKLFFEHQAFKRFIDMVRSKPRFEFLVVEEYKVVDGHKERGSTLYQSVNLNKSERWVMDDL